MHMSFPTSCELPKNNSTCTLYTHSHDLRVSKACPEKIEIYNRSNFEVFWLFLDTKAGIECQKKENSNFDKDETEVRGEKFSLSQDTV